MLQVHHREASAEQKVSVHLDKLLASFSKFVRCKVNRNQNIERYCVNRMSEAYTLSLSFKTLLVTRCNLHNFNVNLHISRQFLNNSYRERIGPVDIQTSSLQTVWVPVKLPLLICRRFFFAARIIVPVFYNVIKRALYCRPLPLQVVGLIATCKTTYLFSMAISRLWFKDEVLGKSISRECCLK